MLIKGDNLNKYRDQLGLKIAGLIIPLFAVLISFGAPVFGQDEPPDDVVPPPISVISKDEQEKLDGEKGIKSRTKLALDFMEARLKESESLVEQDEYEGSLDQLGFFRALMNNTLAFLLQEPNEKSSLKGLKRFERTLKEFIPRLELVRREMPYRYGYHVRVLIYSIKDTREKSIEPFYGDTVIPNGL